MHQDDRIGPAAATDPEPGLSKPARALLGWLREAGEPMTVASIADGLGRHTNSVRMHLDDLIAAGLVLAGNAPAVGRGRPAILYSPAPTPLPAITLVKPLVELVAALPDGEVRAREAGVKWARDLELADQPDALEPTLTRMGFEPEREGDGYRLHACPWLDAATAHPNVVCAMHEGMTQEIVGDGKRATLQPFTAHRTCDIQIVNRTHRD